MSNERYMTAQDAARTLGVSLPTLYAYVSRGLIRSEPAAEGKRQRRYYAEDIEKLVARREGRRNPENLVQDALHWGAPVLDSALTLIDKNRLYYRGYDAAHLARHNSVEEVANLLWMGVRAPKENPFDAEVAIMAQKYETMLLHLDVDGADLPPLQTLQLLLSLASADDLASYDLRQSAVTQTGARILKLMAAVLSGNVSGDDTLARTLAAGWRPEDERAERLLNAALILCADEELNASSFSARVAASAWATPYDVVLAGLAVISGVRHGGYTERVEAFLEEIGEHRNVRTVMAGRLRRGESLPGFGNRLYPSGDPRALTLLAIMEENYRDVPEFMLAQNVIQEAARLMNEEPALDFALATLTSVLGLPRGSGLALFAVGRTIGWIAHAIEQYHFDQMIRPRARYIGEAPQT